MVWEWQRGNLNYLQFTDWKKWGVEVGFSTRQGGVSTEPYSSLNLGLHVGDKPVAVIENRKRWLSVWGAGWEEVAIGEQVHGTKVAWVDRDNDASLAESAKHNNTREAFRDIEGIQSLEHRTSNHELRIAGVDGLLTQSLLGLMGFFADCVPLFFYQSDIQAVGLAHAGWRGTVGKIVLQVMRSLTERGGRPENLWVALGPSIGPCCYEVDEKVAEEVRLNFDHTPFLSPTQPGHYVLDLWQTNIQTLLKAGVPAHQISSAGICTSCHPEEFFSYRRDGNPTGRMAGWIRLRAEGRNLLGHDFGR